VKGKVILTLSKAWNWKTSLSRARRRDDKFYSQNFRGWLWIIHRKIICVIQKVL